MVQYVADNMVETYDLVFLGAVVFDLTRSGAEMNLATRLTDFSFIYTGFWSKVNSNEVCKDKSLKGFNLNCRLFSHLQIAIHEIIHREHLCAH